MIINLFAAILGAVTCITNAVMGDWKDVAFFGFLAAINLYFYLEDRR